MHTRNCLFMLPVVAILTGCMGMPQHHQHSDAVASRHVSARAIPKPPKHCKPNGPACAVTVTVTCPRVECIDTTADVIVLQHGHKPKIIFSIDDAHHLKSIDFDPKSKIICGATTTSDWICDSRDAVEGVFKFSIVVQDVGTLDPWVVND